jgi:hypothetical protein
MQINWLALLNVSVVSFGVAVLAVVLIAFALVGLSARTPGAAFEGGGAPARPGVSPAVGTTIAVVCLAGVVLIAGYGLWIIIS